MNPPQCLESLKIANYFGTKIPRWLSLSFLSNLHHLDIIGCNFFQSFPPLGRLPELISLCLTDSSALKDIGAEFMGIDNHHQMVPFPKLENLHLQGLQNLKTWTDIEVGAFPSLQELQLESCPELQRLPAGAASARQICMSSCHGAGPLQNRRAAWRSASRSCPAPGAAPPRRTGETRD
jgi:hypothetical protein